MLTLRQRIFAGLGLVVGLVLVFLLLYLYLWPQLKEKSATAPADEELSETALIGAGQPSIGAGGQIPAGPAISGSFSEETYVKQVARMFVERFGSYSNQANNQHLVDVLPLVTPSMVVWLKTQSQEQGQIYEGLTTRVVASQVSSFTDSRATILIEAQREIQSAAGLKLEQRSGRVELLKTNADWKVDGFYWDK